MSSTTHDSALLVVLGESIMSEVVETCTSTLIYGVFILLFSQTTMTYIKKKQRSWAQHWMFIASAAAFTIFTIYEAARLVGVGLVIHAGLVLGLVEYPGLSLVEKQLVNGQLNKLNIIAEWTTTFQILISDGIVVWRVFVLLQHRKWLKSVPVVLLLATSVSFFVFLIFELAPANLDSGVVRNFDTAAAMLSIATNVVATALIGWIYWLHRRDMLTGLGKHQPTQAESILSMLVESGIVFFIFQATTFILGWEVHAELVSTAGSYALVVFGQVYFGFSAIYPTLVIALVNSHRTIDHMYSQNTSLPRIRYGSNPQHSISIHFARMDHAASAETLPQQVEKSQDIQEV